VIFENVAGEIGSNLLKSRSKITRVHVRYFLSGNTESSNGMATLKILETWFGALQIFSFWRQD